MKACTKCKKTKELTEFNKDKTKPDGYRSNCKECKSKTDKSYRKNNEDRIRQREKEFRKNNKEGEKRRRKRYYENNKEKEKKNAKRWKEENPEKVNEINKRHYHKVLKDDIEFKVARNLRKAVWKFVKNKYSTTKELAGCSWEKLAKHLESQFYNHPVTGKEMTLGNYGEWHIDHIIPLSSFDLMDPREQRRACHYTNLQPLWADHNLQKGNKILSVKEINLLKENKLCA